jgi:hypothetical protein
MEQTFTRFIRNWIDSYLSSKKRKGGERKMKKVPSVVTIAIISALMLSMVFVAPLTYAAEATIWTDKSDYSPGDTAVISGSGFLSNANVTISVTRPNSTVDTIYAMTDGSGGFVRDYQLDGATGNYTIVATDGMNTATTEFTDKVVKISITVTPTSAVAGSTTTFAISVSVPTPDSNYQTVGSIAISMGAVSGSNWAGPSIISLTGVTGWIVQTYDPTIHLGCPPAAPSSHDLQPGQTLTLTFDVTAPSATGSSTWSVIGYNSRTFSGTSDTEYESISVTTPPTVSVTITSSPVTGSGFVNVDGSPITTPYTFAWTIGDTHTLKALSPASGGAGKQYIYTSWSAPSFGSSTSQTYSYTVPSSAETVTASYKTRYQVTFQQSGLGGDAVGTVLTVGAGTYGYSQLPLTSVWVDDGTTYSYNGTVSAGSGKQYVLTGVTGPGSPIHSSGTITGNYKTQYYLTVTSAHDTPNPAGGWFDAGTGITASVTSPWSGSTGTQYVCIGWTGTGSVSSSGNGTSVSFNINAPSTITWNWKTQYYLTVVSPYDTPSGGGWYDSGTNAYAKLATGVQNITANVRAVFTGWSSDASGNGTTSNAIFMNGPKTAIATWKIQYYLSVVTNPSNLPPIPGANWYDNCTWVSLTAPQYVPNAAGLNGVRYRFSYWDVDGTSQGMGTNPISVYMNEPHTATAHFVLQYLVTFNQTGLNGTASGTIVTVNSSAKTYGDLPFSTWVDNGTTVSYSYEAMVPSSASGERFWLNSVAGPVSPITVNAPVTVTGNYVIQYYLTLATSPSGVNSPIGEGWYDSGTYASISTPQDVDIVPGSSRYDFRGWQTTDMSEIADGGLTATTVFMDEAKKVTAEYVTQYYVTFGQSGVGSDFTGTVVIIGGIGYDRSGASFWYDNSSAHNFAFQSPLVVPPGAKEYDWNSTTGLSTSQSGSVTVTGPGSVTGSYVMLVHDVAVTSVVSDRTWVYQGWCIAYSARINVTVQNLGNFSETVGVTLYYNITAGKIVGAQTISLNVGETRTLTFPWDTTGVPYCHNYTMTAVASIPLDINMTNNVLADGKIKVRILGDVNGDGIVDMSDVASVARSFGSVPGDPRWVHDYDINNDAFIDMTDISLVAHNFGMCA